MQQSGFITVISIAFTPRMAPGTWLAIMIFTIACLTPMELKVDRRQVSEPLRFTTTAFTGHSHPVGTAEERNCTYSRQHVGGSRAYSRDGSSTVPDYHERSSTGTVSREQQMGPKRYGRQRDKCAGSQSFCLREWNRGRKSTTLAYCQPLAELGHEPMGQL